jgi:hypothetical protein
LKTPKLLRWTGVGIVPLAAMLVGACAQILGVNDGTPFPDAGDARIDHTIDSQVDGHVVDSGRDVAADHPQPIDVPIDVVCTELDGFCTNRCGELRDNCDAAVTCPDLCTDGATCNDSGSCSCTPESVSEACGVQNCATALNNCFQPVPCGAKGTPFCDYSSDICLDGGVCCSPEPPIIACGNQCNTTALNGCGDGSVDCTCADGSVCTPSNECCAPVPNDAWCVGRCGLVVNNCDASVMCSTNCGDGGTCNMGSCCPYESTMAACGSQQCGSTTNNCNSPVLCGTCSKNAVCLDSGTCCTPDASACGNTVCNTTITTCGESVTCNDTCNDGNVCVMGDGGDVCCDPEKITKLCTGNNCGPFFNNCGQLKTCSCSTGGECDAGDAGPRGCCFDNGTACNGQCSGTATNNCGNTVSCDNPCDAGRICPDGGMTCCTPNGGGCVLPTDCCNTNCNPSPDGGSTFCCNPSGGGCATSTDCCSTSCNLDAGADGGVCN